MLKETFIELAQTCSADKVWINNLWHEIEVSYSKKNRHYHTLTHLESLLKQLSGIRTEIKNLDAILFALFYHDIIYNPLKKNNEEKSAALCIKMLKEISVEKSIIEITCNLILATKDHSLTTDNDTNIFTDADLSILGANRNDYSTYCKQIRKEYSIYPDLVYNSGRKKLLQHFLAMERIYKIGFFFQKFEAQARQNLQWELEQLQ